MSSKLSNGAVLPHGLLVNDPANDFAGFNKSYKNSALRIGVVKDIYPVSSDSNRSKLTTEYDVIVIEQNEDKGGTSLLYRNCMSAEGLGSVADYFERTLRKVENKTTKGQSLDIKGQNGAVVLVLCLDSMSDKGIILSQLTNPDRNTSLADDLPHLQGEYNGVNIEVDSDGSCTLTFKGATDNDGNPTDPTQGNTVLSIEKDGSYQVSHKTITQRFDKGGAASLTAQKDITNTTQTNFTVNATQNINLNATQNFNLACAQYTSTATGSALFAGQSIALQSQSSFNVQCATASIQAEALVRINSITTIVNGQVYLGSAGGTPVLTMLTKMLGSGNLGAPVISFPISGFAVQTFAT